MPISTEKTALEKEIRLLQKINSMLNSGEGQSKILNTITHGLTSVFNYYLSAIYILNDERTKLICKSYSADSKLLKNLEKLTGLKPLNYEIPLVEGSVFSEILSARKPMITRNIVKLAKDHTDKRHLKMLAGTLARASRIEHGAGVPLLAGNKLVGVIGIGNKEQITNKDIERLRNFGRQAGLAIEKAKIDRHLKECSKELEKKVDERTEEFKSFTEKTHRYLREKITQLLDIIGTFPFKEKDLDDASLMRVDPIGIIGNAIEEVFENLEKTNADLAESRDEIKKSEQKYRLLIETMNDGFGTIDARRKLIFCNKRFAEMVGYGIDELIGRDAIFLFNEENREVLKKELAKRARGESSNYEIEFTTKTGRQLPALMSATPLFDEEGNPNGSFAVITDITERKKMEQAIKEYSERLEQKVTERTKELQKAYDELRTLDKMKDEFISMAAHELKTPLTSINSFLQLISSGKLGELTDKQKNGMEVASHNIKRLWNSIDKILDISSLESGKIKFSMKEVQLPELIQRVVEDTKSLADQKRIVIKTKIKKLHLIKADKDWLAGVVINLISNAIKFTPNGGKITIEGEDKKTHVLVKVKDTGIGISKENLTKIFDRFFQADHTIPGSGLGLNICKMIIEKHGGKIWANSVLGKGSTFYFTLPKKD